MCGYDGVSGGREVSRDSTFSICSGSAAGPAPLRRQLWHYLPRQKSRPVALLIMKGGAWGLLALK